MSDYKYDVIIIGSGMGSLTCGNYLAKAGMKVAIFEQNYKVGGYCSSFKRGNFTFDTSVHAIGDLGDNGIFKRLIEELGINKKIKFVRPDHHDKIIFPEFSFTLENNIRETKFQIQKRFPKEAKNIERFFNFIENSNFIKLYSYLHKKTFRDILDKYFSNPKLKKIFYCLVGNSGIMPFQISAISAIDLYKRWVFDGGYYPQGGMQNLADTFAKNFKEWGGKIYLSSLVKKIIIKNKKAEGVLLKDNTRLRAKYIISNADATQTFLSLVGIRQLPCKFINTLLKMQPTLSAFFVYLGLDNKLSELGMTCNLWYMYNIKDDPSMIKKAEDNEYLLLLSSSLYDSSLAPYNGDTLNLMRYLPFKSKDYCKKNKFKISDRYIKKAEELLPGLTNHIVFKEIATPYTFYRYTLNYKGAVGGWALLPSQVGKLRLSPITPIKNLFLVGHWTRPAIGINSVAISGAFVAQQILKNFKK